MIRLFVGIDLPAATRDRLAALCTGLPGAKWVRPENMHLTLRFIGDVETGLAEDIAAALSTLRAPRFELTLDGVGIFGKPAAARLLWVGVRHCDALARLRVKVEMTLRRVGLPAEERKFSPHVTLARLRGTPMQRLQRFIAGNAAFLSAPVSVDDVVLYSSFRSSSGAIYTPELRFPLIPLSGDGVRSAPAEFG